MYQPNIGEMCRHPRHRMLAKSLSLGLLTAVVAGLSAGWVGAASQSREFRIGPIDQPVAGVSVSVSGKLSVSPNPSECGALDATVDLDLEDFVAKALQIAKASGIEKDEECGDKVTLDGVIVQRDGDGLRVKVDGNVGREQCAKADVPVIHGFNVRMETQIVGRTTLRTNASVKATFVPVIVDKKALRLQRMGDVHIDISNDALREILKAIHYDDRIVSKLGGAVDDALAGDKARFVIPDALKQSNVTLEGARIIDGPKGPALEIKGSLKASPGSAKVMYDMLAFSSDGC